MKHLIIGCGTAAFSALKEIRNITSEGEVKLVTMEEYFPYSPAALPYLISKRIREEDLWLGDASYFEKMKASLVRNKEVVSLSPQTREVTYKDGRQEEYDTLLISCGADPTWPPIKGLDSVEALGFHTLADYEKLAKQLDGKKDVAIYGGGLVALEMATALLESGYQVKIIVRSRLLRRLFDKGVSGLIEDIFRQHGAHIYKGGEINEVKQKGNKIEILLSTGDSLSAELLISNLGVRPRIAFLKGSGIRVNSGVLVDKKMRTNIPNVYAAGDVAEGPDFFSGQPGLNAISPNAIEQGKVAGANMAGQETESNGWIAMNILKFLGHSAFAIGLNAAEVDSTKYQVFKQEDNRDKCYKELVFQGNKLVGARFFDVEIDPGTIRYLIEARVDIIDDKALLFNRPVEVSRKLMLEAERK